MRSDRERWLMVMRRVDMAVAGLCGAVVLLAALWRLAHPLPDPPHPAPRTTPPPCYSIGTWVAPGCSVR